MIVYAEFFVSSIGQQNEEKILSCLLESCPAGKSTSELWAS